MEAHYAYQQQRHLIPLIVRGPYRADGWLGLLTTNKIYIDFHKHRNFDEAYSKIIQEINRYRSQSVANMPAPLVSSRESTGHLIDVKPSSVVM